MEYVSPAYAAYEKTLFEMAKSKKLDGRHVLSICDGVIIYNERLMIYEQRQQYPSLLVFRRRLNYDLYLWKDIYYQFMHDFERDDVTDDIHSDDTSSTYDWLED